MKLIALLLIVSITAGCATLTPERKAQWTGTGQWLLHKAEGIALSTIASAATSQLDGSAKADWMDSLSTGLRTRAVASFGSADVDQLIGIWTPTKPHWQQLGTQLATLAASSTSLPPAQRAEILAQALATAAAQLRAESTGPTQVSRSPAFPADLPPSWREPLEHEGQRLEPRLILGVGPAVVSLPPAGPQVTLNGRVVE